MSDATTSPDETQPAPKWKPISSVERRILGVLGEKAKTTPDAYPLPLNALTTGSNQKSNRYPQMNLESHKIETALEKLRAIGVVSEVQGGGRVPRYRHYLYEWLGVDKTEIAVMIELLLRGAQTVGELRGRAARMEPEIRDVSALRPIVNALIGRGLVVALSPEGRGQMVTHALYQDEEWEQVKRQAAEQAAAAPASTSAPSAGSSESSSSATTSSSSNSSSDVAKLQAEVEELRAEVTKLRSEVEDIWNNLK